jgi:hypothetical protein
MYFLVVLGLLGRWGSFSVFEQVPGLALLFLWLESNLIAH